MAGVITFIGRSVQVKGGLTHVMAALRLLTVGLWGQARPFLERAMKGGGFRITRRGRDRVDAFMRLIQEIE